MRVVLRVAAALTMAAVAIVLLGFILYAPRVPSTTARVVAERQLALVLDPDERVTSTTPAIRRPLWRYFHPISGVLAATDRRLLWVGHAPRSLIEWSSSDPPVFEVVTWRYDSAFIAPTRVHLGVSPGLAVRSAPDAPALRFAVRRADADRRAAVIAVVEQRQAELREEAERERREQERLAELARQPVYHTVEPGDAVISIAQRYGITPDSLRKLNDLESDRLFVGQVLLVKPGAER